MKIEAPEIILGAVIVYLVMNRPIPIPEEVPEEVEEQPKPVRQIPYGFTSGIEQQPWGPPAAVARVTAEQKRRIARIDP